MTDAVAAVEAHVAAFNARDADAVLATFSDDAVFSNADDLVVGRTALSAMFRDAFEAPLRANLQVQRAVVDGDTVACELTERLDYAGTTFQAALAGFFTVRDGLLVRVRIYREGSAD